MSPHTVTGVRTGWMFDSAGDELMPWGQGLCCIGVFTFHKTLFYNLAQSLHVGLGQVLAALGLLQPFVGPGAFGQAGGPWLGDVVVFAHGVDVAAKRRT